MTTTFSVRLDDIAEKKLAQLAAHGRSRNAVIRHALDVAYREYVEDYMRRESAALLNHPDDRAEIAAVRKAMGAGDAW